MPKSGERWRAALATLAIVGGALTAQAESALRLPYPDSFGEIPAATFDAEGHRVGDARVVIEKTENGNVRLYSESGIDGGARTIVTAELQPIDAGSALRPLREESRSFDPHGTPLGVLSIDHLDRTASCRKPDGDGFDEKSVGLPAADRVANVPLHLYFLPLVQGEADELEFQLFLCGEGPRLVDFVARVERDGRDANRSLDPPVIEVRYRPDFNRIVSLIAERLMPKLSFWFDRAAPHRWIGHRVPLYASGPEVFVVREGVSTGWLGSR